MNKKFRALYLAVGDALQKNQCIAGYAMTDDDMAPHWKEGGAERALQELMSNPEPFGLKKDQRAALLLVLPQEQKNKIDQFVIENLARRRGR